MGKSIGFFLDTIGYFPYNKERLQPPGGGFRPPVREKEADRP